MINLIPAWTSVPLFLSRSIFFSMFHKTEPTFHCNHFPPRLQLSLVTGKRIMFKTRPKFFSCQMWLALLAQVEENTQNVKMFPLHCTGSHSWSTTQNTPQSSTKFKIFQLQQSKRINGRACLQRVTLTWQTKIQTVLWLALLALPLLWCFF